MTVSSTDSRKTYAGNGSTTSFATNPVVFFDDVDLTVYVVEDADETNVETLVLDTDYTVSGGDGSTGTVDLSGGSSPYGAPASGYTLVIVRELDIVQEADFVNNDASDAEVAEDAIDRLTMICQELDQRIERSFGLPDSATNTENQRVTPVAGYLIGWDDDGAMVAVDPADVATVAAAQGYSVELHDGTGAQTAFVLASAPGSENNLEVTISGVRQRPGTDYSVSGSTVTFVSAPAAGTENILFKWGAVLGEMTPGDSSVVTVSIADSAVTTDKLNDGAVTTAKLADDAVTADKIASSVGVMTTGDVKLSLKTAADAGWVLMNDGTIGSASSGATARANADVEDLYTLLWTNVANQYCPVTGGRGASAAADFAANKPMKLPAAVGRALATYGAATQTETGVNADVDTTNDTLTVPSNNAKWFTGMAVTFALSSGTVTGLTSGNTYYVIRASATTIKLASTLANAQNGTAIDLTAKSSPVWTITHSFTSRALGEMAGEESHAMSVTELLAHTHTGDGQTQASAGAAGSERYAGVSEPPQTGSKGGNAAMNITQPTLFLNVMIKL
jgi:hypothetical protein